MRVITLIAAVIASACLATPLVQAASAGTGLPNWTVHSFAQPSKLNASDSTNKELSLTVDATGGGFELEVTVAGVSALTSEIAWNESAEGLQQKLEVLPNVGAGNVTVSGGPGASAPLVIEFDGALSGRGGVASVPSGDDHLTGGAGTVEVHEIHGASTLDRYVVAAVNRGAAATQGEITVTDKVPAGVVAAQARISETRSGYEEPCTLGTEVVCHYSGEPVQPGEEIVVVVRVAVASALATGMVENDVAVSGGGALEARGKALNEINSGAALFGIEQYDFESFGEDGRSDDQAGSRPFGVSTTIALNTVFNQHGSVADRERKPLMPAQEAKDVFVELPLGFSGNPLAAERCPEVDLTIVFGTRTACPTDSIVGSMEVVLEGGIRSTNVAVYNVQPEHGYPAELGFNASIGQPILLYASVVPSPDGYRLRVAVPGVLRAAGGLESSTLTIFGDPGRRNGTGSNMAFARNPTACGTGPVKTRLVATSWEGAEDVREAIGYPEITGCSLLQEQAPFSPGIEVTPEQKTSDTPSGYEIDLRMPHEDDAFGRLATGDLKNATVTLPTGVSLSPAVAKGSPGLEACTPQQIDLLGTEVGEGHPGGNGSPYDDGLTHASPGHCPEGSRVGDVEVKTPVLEAPLKGHMYVAAPACGGQGQPACTPASSENGELYGLYLELAGSGVIVKLHGQVSVNAQTGQISTTFRENPQLPFEELKLNVYGGQRAPVATPQTCGTFTTVSDLEPWSAPGSGADAMPSSTLAVGGCPASMPFAPRFQAGDTQTLADGFTSFAVDLTRKDGEQDFGDVSVTLPPGVSGMTANVPRCDELDADAGTCPQSSRIGTARVAAGAGSQPLWLEGPVYFTAPYKGAPFGLSVVIPAKAGPFNLGDEVVRAGITVDPHTAQATTTTEPLRLIRDGVPFRIKAIDVTIDRPEFIFNPTSCAQEHVTGSIAGDMPDGSPGVTTAVSTPFAAAGCKNLPFHPSFKVSTQGRTSKTDGASLDVKVDTAPGTANLREVHVSLPRQLPSRLDTLKLACIDKVFEANPGACPAASAVGTAKAITPILAMPLVGPAYLVSHGGAEFPDLEIVLQGEGVTLILDGKTDIKKNITTSTFSTIPDAPVSSFELKLPEGPHSVLGAPGGKLCTESLAMPTIMRGQNGVLVEQKTKIRVTGCKPAVIVLAHKVTGHTATITASAPAAGTLTASASGLSSAAKRLGKAGKVTFQLTLTQAERKFLAKHPGRRLRAHVVLRFVPKHGKALSTGVTLLVG